MDNQPKSENFKKPLSIFEAIHPSNISEEEVDEAIKEDESEDKKTKPEKYRSEFLFPIQMLF